MALDGLDTQKYPGEYLQTSCGAQRSRKHMLCTKPHRGGPGHGLLRGAQRHAGDRSAAMQAEGGCDGSPAGPGENHEVPGFFLGVEGHRCRKGHVEVHWACRKLGNGMSCHGRSAVPTAGCN